jgi:flagellar basal body rod protein FlgG
VNIAPYLLATKQFGATQENLLLSANASNYLERGRKNAVMVYTPRDIKFKTYLPHGMRDAVYPIQKQGYRYRAEGSLEKTNNPMNVAITGPGFLSLNDGTYTRGGDMNLTAEGLLVNANGIPYQGATGDTITVTESPESVRITSNGTLLGPQGNTIGRLRVVEFKDIDKLQSVGKNRYRTDEPAEEATHSQVLQGYLENSNMGLSVTLARAQVVNRDLIVMSQMLKTFYKTEHDSINQLVFRS